MVDRARHRGRGEGRQRRRAILQRKAAHRLDRKGFAVDTLGRRQIEPGVGQHRGQNCPVHLPPRRAGPAFIIGRVALRLHPIVNEAARHAGVKRDQRAVQPDDGDVGDPAQIEDRGGLGQPIGQRAVIDRQQRRALPACNDIGLAQVGDHRDAERPGQPRAIANLPGPAALRPVGDRMAVKADHADILRDMAAAPQQVGHCLHMAFGQLRLDGCNQRFEARPLHRHRALARFGQAQAKALVIGHGVKFQRRNCALPIRFDERGVNAVARCAGHEADGQGRLRHKGKIRSGLNLCNHYP